MKNTLSVNNLSYGILESINFSLKKNTLNALIGKSGSGKSTLLKCIAGLYDFSGKITINENAITKSSVVKENISLFTNLFVDLKGTSFENIIEPLVNLKFDNLEARKKVYNISKKLGIDNLLYKDIETLSYSEKKMVLIAKTLVVTSDIILLDDVFDSLDFYYKNKVIDYLKDIKESTIIFTTNDSEALMLVDNIIIISEGKTIAVSNRDDLFENESAFIKNELKQPFIIDLSHKLKAYKLIDHLIYKNEDMVNELWK